MRFTPILSLAILTLLAASFVGVYTLVPDDYQLLFKEDFEGKNALKHFEMTDPSAWKITKQADNRMLDLFGASKYEPRMRSPATLR